MSTHKAAIEAVSDVYLAEIVRYDEFRRPFAMGIMSPKVLVKSFPFMMPSLGVLARMRLSDNVRKEGDNYEFILTIEHEKGGEPAAVAMSQFSIGSGPSDFLFRAGFNPPRFENPGKYFFFMRDREHPDKIIAKVLVTEILLASDII